MLDLNTTERRLCPPGPYVIDCSRSPAPASCPTFEASQPTLTWTPGLEVHGSSTNMLVRLIRLLIEADPEKAAKVLREEGVTFHYADGRRIGAGSVVP